MTEDQKYELATLASEVCRLYREWEYRALTNIPRDPLEAEKAYAALKIAETELMQAKERLHRAQRRISYLSC